MNDSSLSDSPRGSVAGHIRSAVLTLVLGSLALLSPLSAQFPMSPPQQAVSAPEGARSLSGPTLVLTGVTVIDVTDGALRPGQTVVVVGNRIHTVRSAGKLPTDAQIVDAKGKYLIPGLWDMHAHIEYQGIHKDYPRFIAHGVTGVREMAQRFKGGTDSFRVWQHDVLGGQRIGPRGAGPSADVDDDPENAIGLVTPDDARRVVDSLKGAGVVFLKVHGRGSAERFFAIMREARRVGLPVVGHVPKAVTNVQASDSGLRSIEHVVFRQCRSKREPGKPEDSLAFQDACIPVAQAYIRNGTWVVPTLLHWHDESKPNENLMPVRVMKRLGVKRFLAGTDVGFGPEPGRSLLKEIMANVGGGLTPLEALQSATLNPALYLDATDSLGTVAAGKLADLILLDGNPLIDIRNVATIRAVVANGRYFDRAALDALDPEGAKDITDFIQRPLPSAFWQSQ